MQDVVMLGFGKYWFWMKIQDRNVVCLMGSFFYEKCKWLQKLYYQSNCNENRLANHMGCEDEVNMLDFENYQFLIKFFKINGFEVLLTTPRWKIRKGGNGWADLAQWISDRLQSKSNRSSRGVWVWGTYARFWKILIFDEIIGVCV
jgi:hypothetical protein